MLKVFIVILFVTTVVVTFLFGSNFLFAQTNITSSESLDTFSLEDILNEQQLGSILPWNPLKYAIRGAITAGVPANTIVLLLLLPVVASLIAAARQLVGIRGFGIFLPASLSVVFVATGPFLGISLFLGIVLVSTITRVILRKLKTKLQYLPRVALILWAVAVAVLGILFLAPILPIPEITNVSIFAVLISVLLSEEVTRVQLGKSLRVAIDLTIETLILALLSYIVLSLRVVHYFALLNPEVILVSVLVFDFVLGKYTGLRVRELWRFKKLIQQ